jgi:hypothetical protein
LFAKSDIIIDTNMANNNLPLWLCGSVALWLCGSVALLKLNIIIISLKKIKKEYKP